jgi:hypothetical protein
MTDWHTLNSDNLPKTSTAGVTEFPQRRWWRSFAILLILLIAIGWVIIWVRLARSRELRQVDLSGVVLAEETARFLGDQEAAAALVNPAAPSIWQSAYRQLFVTPFSHPPGPIQLQEVTFDGHCTTVLVTGTGGARVRTYCLNGGRWQRSPVPRSVWGEVESSLIPPLPLAGVIASSEAQKSGRKVICRFWPDPPSASPDIAGQAKQLICFIDEATLELASPTELFAVELPDLLPLFLADGQNFAAGCAPSDTRVAIEGTWLEAGQRLQVRQIRVPEATPVKPDPALPDTVAYFIESSRPGPAALYRLSRTENCR